MEWNRKPVYGVGINDSKVNTRQSKAYIVWKAMLARCYSENTLKKNQAYKGCSVCEEWLVFSNFKKWFDENYHENAQLDKDILCQGNKVYSPNTCCFVPQEINKFFKGHSHKKVIATGIVKQYNKYRAQFRVGNKTYRASFDTLADAQQFYAEHRKSRITELAESYLANNMITPNVYKAIIRYAVLVHKRESAQGVHNFFRLRLTMYGTSQYRHTL